MPIPYDPSHCAPRSYQWEEIPQHPFPTGMEHHFYAQAAWGQPSARSAAQSSPSLQTPPVASANTNHTDIPLEVGFTQRQSVAAAVHNVGNKPPTSDTSVTNGGTSLQRDSPVHASTSSDHYSPVQTSTSADQLRKGTPAAQRNSACAAINDGSKENPIMAASTLHCGARSFTPTDQNRSEPIRTDQNRSEPIRADQSRL